MYGAIGYLYAEEELNKICEIYGHGKGADTSKVFTYEVGDVIEGLETRTITGSGARSINVDDINKITGYTPAAATTPYTKSMYYPTRITETGYSESVVNRTDASTYYFYTGSTYLDSTSEIYKMLFIHISDSGTINYWLASRCVYSMSDYSYFDTREVMSGFVQYYNFLGVGNAYVFGGGNRINGVRPVVYLKSTVQTSGQDSSGAWTIIDN